MHGTHSITTQTITEYGFYLTYGTLTHGSSYYNISSNSSLSWDYSAGPPLDTLTSTVGGNKQYFYNAYLIVDGIEIRDALVQSFWTPLWPRVQNVDIIRSVQDDLGLVRLQGRVIDYGSGIEDASAGSLGFYVTDVSKPSADNYLFNLVGTALGILEGTIFEEEKDSLELGKIYYMNAYIEGSHGKYYEESATLERPSGFPVGVQFKIPIIDTSGVNVLSGSSVKLYLNIVDTGETSDIVGTDEIGFYISESLNNCFDGAALKVEISSWGGSSGIYTYDIGEREAGRVYYYGAYTKSSRGGEGIDSNDIWYPVGYISGNSENIVNYFCIAKLDYSLISELDFDSVKVTNKLIDSTPYPYPIDYGILYWYGSSSEIKESGVGLVPVPGTSWDFNIDGLVSGLQYNVVPFVIQNEELIRGETVNFITDLLLCDISSFTITDILGIEDIVSGKFTIILAFNPPYPSESGRCIKLGFTYNIGEVYAPTSILSDDPLVYDFGSQIDLTPKEVTLTNLSTNRHYYVRTFVENQPLSGGVGGGLYYGEIFEFTTPLLPPKIVSNINSVEIYNGYTVSSQILSNPDPEFGNIIAYGFCWKLVGLAEEDPGLPVVTIDDADGSNNLLSGIFDTEYNFELPYDVGFDLIFNTDISYNRAYFIRFYVINSTGSLENIVYNSENFQLIARLPDPFIEFSGELLKPKLLSTELFSYVRASINIGNYDPTIWGGIVEFGLLWDTATDDIASTDFTLDTLSERGGLYKRGDRNGNPEDFQEGSAINPAAYDIVGIWPDASSVYLGTFGISFSEAGLIMPQDPSSVPFNISYDYYVRPYIFIKSIIFNNRDTVPTLIYGDVKTVNFNFGPALVETNFGGGV